MVEEVKREKGNFITCYICGKRIITGQSWDHDPKTDKTGHFSCVYKRST
jgi:hypothetical protein